MDLIPLSDNVVIEVEPGPEKSEGGIFLPPKPKFTKDTFAFGRVISTGPGRKTKSGTRLTPTVKAGDRVLFDDHLVLRELQREPKRVVCPEENILFVDGRARG